MERDCKRYSAKYLRLPIYSNKSRRSVAPTYDFHTTFQAIYRLENRSARGTKANTWLRYL